VKSANRVNRRKGFTYFLRFKIPFQACACPQAPGLAPAAVETEAVAAWGFVRRHSVGQISIEQALIAAGVNLLHPFGPAFCFAVIVCFSLEYKILGLAGGPPSCSGCQPAGSILYQPAGSINPLFPFYINAQPPWPDLDFLLLLDQAKRRKLCAHCKKIPIFVLSSRLEEANCEQFFERSDR